MISYGRQSIGQDDIDSVVATLNSDLLTVGPRVLEFEQMLCQITGARYAISCSNCTTALHLSCLALGLTADDQGLTSPITFVASANAIEMCGAKTGLIDIDHSYCMNPQKLEEYCRSNPAPRVVIPVSFAGIPANLPEIYTLAKKYGFSVIEDAAHSLGSEYKVDGKVFRSASCSHSDLATLSFHPVKTITTGEGGAVLTNDSSLADKIRLLRSHGIERDSSRMEHSDGGWYYEMQTLGYNYRITEIQCALGIAQLRKIEAFKEKRAEIVALYNKAFEDCPEIIRPPLLKDANPVFHLYPIQITKGKDCRRKIYDYLREQGIYSQIHYIPVHLHPYYRDKYNFTTGQFPISELYYSRCLSLPLHCELSASDIEYVIEKTKTAISKF
jgi:perosamine synthetase